jgi:hypothetical protein
MIPDIIGQSTGRFDKRFFLTALVPTAVFGPAIAAVLLKSADRLSSVVAWYARLSPVTQILAWLTVAAAVWFLATLLASQWTSIVKIYEGYPVLRIYEFLNRGLARVRAPAWLRGKPLGIAAHQRRCHTIWKRAQSTAEAPDEAAARPGSAYETRAPADVLYDRYPADIDRVMPTALGNIIRSAEDYAYRRYGFDVIYLWARLTVVLPPEYLDDVEQSVIEYQTPLMVSLGSAILSASSLLLIGSTISTVAFVSIFAGSAFASWVAYRLSFSAAMDYAELLRTAVDLYRTDLLERWWPELLAIDDDRHRLQTLRAFVITGERPSFVSGASGAPTTPSGLIVPDIGDRNLDVEMGDVQYPDESPSRSRLRLSLVAAAGVAVASVIGASYLDQPRWVLVAEQDIAAFTNVRTQVTTTSMRRGSLRDDTLASADDEDDLRLDVIDTALALRDIPEGTVIRRSDIGPENVPPTPESLIIELTRQTAQIESLDLRPGDRVLLDGIDGDGRSMCATDALGSEPRSPYVGGDVLDVVDRQDTGSASVIVQIARDERPLCLGDLSRVEILRSIG